MQHYPGSQSQIAAYGRRAQNRNREVVPYNEAPQATFDGNIYEAQDGQPNCDVLPTQGMPVTLATRNGQPQLPAMDGQPQSPMQTGQLLPSQDIQYGDIRPDMVDYISHLNRAMQPEIQPMAYYMPATSKKPLTDSQVSNLRANAFSCSDTLDNIPSKEPSAGILGTIGSVARHYRQDDTTAPRPVFHCRHQDSQCNCGEQCQCAFCMTHPWNANSRETALDLRNMIQDEVQYSQQIIPGYRDLSFHPSHTDHVQEMLSGDEHFGNYYQLNYTIRPDANGFAQSSDSVQFCPDANAFFDPNLSTSNAPDLNGTIDSSDWAQLHPSFNQFSESSKLLQNNRSCCNPPNQEMDSS